MRKYHLTYGRPVAYRDFGDVCQGDIGGYVDSEDNLSHDGTCWVYDRARVTGGARVYGDAKIYDRALITGNAHVFDDARVFENAVVEGNAIVCGHARIIGATVKGNSRCAGDAELHQKETIDKSSKINSRRSPDKKRKRYIITTG